MNWALHRLAAGARAGAWTALALLGAATWVAVAADVPADDPAVLATELQPQATQSMMLDVCDAATRAIAVGERGHVLVSEDRREWRQVGNVPTRSTLTAVTAVADKVWAVGHDGIILHSTDGGLNWERQRVAPFQAESDDPHNGAPLLDTLFLDDQRGFALGAYSLLLSTTDGGKTWIEISLSQGTAPEGAPGPDPGEAPGDSWTFDQADLKVGEESDPHLNAIARTGDGSLMIVGERGSGFRSTDQGATWQRVRLPYEGSMFGVVGYEERHVLAFGLRGHVLESFDLGTTWRELETQVELSLMGGTARAQGGAVLVGQNGVILNRASASAPFTSSTYETPHDKETPVLASILPLGPDTFVVAGEKGLDAFQLHQ